jgi:Icc-related predicted phosphoesterase
MRICFTSDFHGSRAQYDRLGDLLRRERPELAILGGDMLPDGEDHDPDGTQAAFVHDYLSPRIGIWKQEIPGLVVAFLMGNHDWLRSETAARAEHDAGRLVLLESRRVWSHKGVNFLGCPLSPPTPHWVKDYECLDAEGDEPAVFDGATWATGPNGVCEVDVRKYFREKPALATELDAAATPREPWILIAHAPPWNTKLDRLPSVDYPIGSKAVRSFVESRRPLCALHGHVHESPELTGSYFDEVGGVLCINPGQSHERLQAVLFDSERPRDTLQHTVFG